MTSAVLLILGVAVADILGWLLTRVTSDRNRPLVVQITVGVWAIMVGLYALWLNDPIWAVVLLTVGVAAWPALTAVWAAAALGYLALAVVFAAYVPHFAIRFVGELTQLQVLAVAAVALFLGLSANLVCRGALRRARAAEEPTLVTAAGARQQGAPGIAARMREALTERWVTQPLAAGEMRGGRIIGPLERWILVALALVGAQGIVAALMAAKGIVRFPEISKNSGDGSKAEEFLVGSLISWGLAGAGAAFIYFAV